MILRVSICLNHFLSKNPVFLRYLATVVGSVNFSPHLSHSAGRIFSLPLVMKCLYQPSSGVCPPVLNLARIVFSRRVSPSSLGALTSSALAKWGFASSIHLLLHFLFTRALAVWKSTSTLSSGRWVASSASLSAFSFPSIPQ